MGVNKYNLQTYSKTFEFIHNNRTKTDKNKIVVVLIKSNTSLDETIDNILGYYYEEEEDIPKSLF